MQVKVIPTYKNTGGADVFDFPEPKINETNTHTGEQEEACSALGGTMVSDFICKINESSTVVEKDGSVEDDKKDKVDFGLLNYKKLLLGVFQSKRQSRVVIS